MDIWPSVGTLDHEATPEVHKMPVNAILLAGSPAPQALVIALAVSVLLIVAVFAMTAVMVTKYYVRCPSNRILVVGGMTGQGKEFQCFHGGAKFVIPLLQDYRWLSLDAIRVEISGPAATDELAESLFLPNVFNIVIGTEPDLMQCAAERLLGLSADEIRQLAEDTIASRLDRVLAEQRSRPSDDGPALIHSLNGAVEAELNQLGLTLLNSRRA